jgi:hypothetical protein
MAAMVLLSAVDWRKGDMPKATSYLLLLAAGLWMTTACANGKDLSRSQAQRLIVKDQQFNSPLTTDIPIGNFWWDARDIGSIDAKVKQFEDVGVLTYRKSGRSQWVYVERSVELTPLGKEAAKGWTIKQKDFGTGGTPCRPELVGTGAFCRPPSNAVLNSVVYAQRRFKEITGIRVVDLGGRLAIADFDYELVPNPMIEDIIKRAKGDKSVGPTEWKGHADFELYDDGWRLSAIHLLQ